MFDTGDAAICEGGQFCHALCRPECWPRALCCAGLGRLPCVGSAARDCRAEQPGARGRSGAAPALPEAPAAGSAASYSGRLGTPPVPGTPPRQPGRGVGVLACWSVSESYLLKLCRFCIRTCEGSRSPPHFVFCSCSVSVWSRRHSDVRCLGRVGARSPLALPTRELLVVLAGAQGGSPFGAGGVWWKRFGTTQGFPGG